MSLSTLLLWLVAGSTVMSIVHALRADARGMRGWIALCVAVLAVAGLSILLAGDYAGWIAAAVWLVLILLPALLSRVVVRRSVERRFGAAARYSRLLSWLQPFGPWRFDAELRSAIDEAERGKTAQALAAFDRLERMPRLPPRFRTTIAAYRAMLHGDWDRVIAVLSSPGTGADGTLLPYALRALGETGRLDQLAAAFAASSPRLGVNHAFCQLFLFAFFGRVAAVERLLARELGALDRERATFWVATAQRVARGDAASATSALEALSRTAESTMLRGDAARRLSVPPSRRASAEALQVVEREEAALQRDDSYRVSHRRDWRESPVTMTLIALNLAFFVVELASGGSENPEVLWRLGALWTPAPLTELWRAVTANFLHFGPGHLALNMLALLLLGPWVERRLGRAAMLVVYFGSGVGAMLVMIGLFRLGWQEPKFVVGASAAIFGLVGAQLVLLVRGRRRGESGLARRRLGDLAGGLALQVAFDLTSPEVSSTAHVVGFLLGILLTALVARAGRQAADV